MKQPMKNMMQKERFDNLYTPEIAIKPLIKHIEFYFGSDIKNNRDGFTFWECTDFGDSNITKMLREKGWDVTGTDITNGYNFLTCDPPEFDFIVTNPPYSLKDKFLQRCYDLGKPFALLLPLTALEGIKRGNMFRSNGISVIVLDKRIDFTGKKSNWFNVSWFTWGIRPNNKIIFEQVEK